MTTGWKSPPAVARYPDTMRARVEKLLHKSPSLMVRLRQVLDRSPRIAKMVWTVRAKQLLVLDYPVTSAPRYGHGKPPHARLSEIIGRNDSQYVDLLEQALAHRDRLAAIPVMPRGTGSPSWENGWLPALDMVANYTLLAKHRPRRYLEIGSGESTKLARKAIDDFDLGTELISIDPFPRAEVDVLCDAVVRTRLEDADLSVFDKIEPGDFVFFDGSHRCFMNSDVAVFFLDVLPNLPTGTIVGIHDIDLPWDHSPEWAGRYYNEQYLLATYLLSRETGKDVLFPARYITVTEKLNAVLAPLWADPRLAGVRPMGRSFWFTA